MDKKIDYPQAVQKPHDNFNDNSAHSQRMRLLAEMQARQSVTTIQARRDLDILMPAARVFELREMGYDIATIWTHDTTDCGRKHRIARYVLGIGSGHD